MKSQIVGMEHAFKVLEALPNAAAQRVTANAVGAAGRVLLGAAKRYVPKSTTRRRGTHLRDALAVEVVREKGGRTAKAFIGAKRNKAKHAHLVEFGSGPRRQKNGRWTGTMPASPFLRRAMESDGPRASALFVRAFGRGLEREATRLAQGRLNLQGRIIRR
jgi:HK97 gp10 family phage protein